MSLKTCTSLLGYDYDGDHLCLPVSVDVQQDEFTYQPAWIAGAFFLGLVLGAGIVLLLTTYCLYAWKRKQEQLHISQNVQVTAVEAQAANGRVSVSREKSVANKKKEMISKFQFWKRKKPMVEQDMTRPDTKPTLQKNEYKRKPRNLDATVTHGMVDVMLQTSKCESEVEMAQQDLVAIVAMERSKEEEMSTLLQHILTILLIKKTKERAITKNFCNYFIKKTEEDIKDVTETINRERKQDEEKLRSDPKFSKDTQTLEAELQKSQTHYNNKQSKLQRDLRNKIRQGLMRSSGLKENEINDLMAELTRNLAVAEEKIGLEQERQRRALEMRLARRRQVIEYMEIEAMENELQKDACVEKIRSLLPLQLNGSHRLESHADDIVKEFANELDGIRKYFPKEFHNACNEKYDFLQNSRLDNFLKLEKDQNKEKAELLHKSQQTTNAIDFIQRYHKMMINHHQQTEVLWEDQDQAEVKKIYEIQQQITNKEKIEMDAETEKLANKLNNEIPMSSDVERIMRLYKAEMEKYQAEKQKEKQAALARLQEKLQQRIKTADFREKQHQKELETLKEEQMATMNKVLAMNIDLTEKEKDQILTEHEQNMKVLSNQLLCSKLRLQKSLEIKLNKRKLQLEKLRLMKNNLHRSNKQNKNDQLAKLSADIAKEEQLLEEARQAAVTELRKQLAKETEEALKLQTDSISLLIGRLQLGEARRKVILAHQKGTLKELQDTLDVTLAHSAPFSSEMEEILKQHNGNMTLLEKQLQRQREEKENKIKEKIRNRKQALEQETEDELEEAQSEYTYQQKGTSFASLALVQLLLKQRHDKAMQTLNSEMTAELEKCKSELNLEYELKLKEGLEVQMQEMLTKLAAMSNMSRNDLQEALSAVASGNADSEGLQQLVENLRLVNQKTIIQS
ncbi:hypothetical protein BsWGS_01199 [Bradybaena similaris]